MWKLILSLCLLCHKGIGAQAKDYQSYLELQSVKLFQEYIQIDTSIEENLQVAVDFWKRQATELGLPYVVYEPAGLPIFVATLEGSNPALPSIMLNSHMDVVPADPSEWTYPPFDAYMDENGDIYGRGTQDTKDVGIQYLEAIRRLKNDNVTLARTVHITLMPDEELGGTKGMQPFTQSSEFQSLNVGFALDEGAASPEDNLFVTYVDKRPWHMLFTINGVGGHSYQMPDNSAMEKTQRFINAVMWYRAQQKQIVLSKSPIDFSGYSSLNINVIHGGTATNVVASQMNATVDMRLSPDADVNEMNRLVQSWMDAAGEGTEVTYILKDELSGITAVNDSNPFWVAMRDSINSMGIEVIPLVSPATTDIRAVRNLGIPALGFSAKTNTTPRLHAVDEYQNVEVFLKGIDIYTEVIKNVANVPGN